MSDNFEESPFAGFLRAVKEPDNYAYLLSRVREVRKEIENIITVSREGDAMRTGYIYCDGLYSALHVLDRLVPEAKGEGK